MRGGKWEPLRIVFIIMIFITPAVCGVFFLIFAFVMNLFFLGTSWFYNIVFLGFIVFTV